MTCYRQVLSRNQTSYRNANILGLINYCLSCFSPNVPVFMFLCFYHGMATFRLIYPMFRARIYFTLILMHTENVPSCARKIWGNNRMTARRYVISTCCKYCAFSWIYWWRPRMEISLNIYFSYTIAPIIHPYSN
jgi:hypothetical protein